MEEKLFRNVLVPVNASDLSERVINKVEQMALHGVLGDIFIMTIWDFHSVDYSKLHAPDKEKMLINQAQAVIDKYAGQLKSQGIVIKSILTGGDPATAILKEIQEGDYDLVIMGSRRLNKFQEIVSFSVSDRITRLSSIPVLVVK
ncbi:MAG: universal stress protein [Syntrophomonas sp.]|mgnify:FL=1|nr:universal stress protein [Syntrophomonas sp.]